MLLPLPTSIQVDASSHCQLHCPLCPTRQFRLNNEPGFLKVADFKRLLEQNPQIRRVNFASRGEAFLNQDLPELLRYAYEKKVTTDLNNGVNLNDASAEALEALVRYQTDRLRISLDGVTQETYQKYRVGGKLARVIENINKINEFKAKYGSVKPRLILNFIIFGHNEHEIEAAKRLALLLHMDIHLHLNRSPKALPVKNREMIRRYVGYADRREYLEKTKKNLMRHKCYHLWKKPLISWNGALLGCSGNFWGSFAEGVFHAPLADSFNSEKMQYARAMLSGRKPDRDDIPCVQCPLYADLRHYNNWITEAEIFQPGSTRTPGANEAV